MSFWDEKFSTTDYVFGEAPNAFLERQADRIKGLDTALAVADGEGRNGVWLAGLGLDVLSIDGSQVGLDKANALAVRRGVSIVTRQEDVASFDWSARQFDLVVGIFIQFAAPALRDAMFAGMRAALKPGGLLLIEGYGPKQLEYATGGPSQLDQLYTAELLREKFGDLELIELTEYDAELSEGQRHVGTSALVDLVARKPR